MKSWPVTAASFCINMLTFGALQVAATTLSPSVTTAVRVVLFTMAMRSISGPLAGFLASQFGARYVAIFGNLIASVGLFTCYFEIIPNSFCGVLFGLGMGFGNTLLPAFINQAFDTHRAKAMCMAYSGESIGCLVLTPLADAALNAYGTSETHLLLSALFLNCLPAGFLLKTSPRPINKLPKAKVTFYMGNEASESSSANQDDAPSSSLVIPTIEIDGLSDSSSRISYRDKVKRFSTQTLRSNYFLRMSCSDTFNIDSIVEDNGQLLVTASSQNEDLLKKYVAMNLKSERCHFASMQCERPLYTMPSVGIRQGSLKPSVSDSGKAYFGRHPDPNDERFYEQTSSRSNREDFLQLTQNNDDLYDCYPASEDFARRKSVITNDSDIESFREENQADTERSRNGFKKNLRFFLHPIFLLVALSSSVALITSAWILPVSCRNPHVYSSFGHSIYYILSGAELLGYITHGFIIDGGRVTMATFLFFAFSAEGLVVILLPWFQNTAAISTLVAVTGFIDAGIRAVLPVMIGDYMENSKQAVVIPCKLILSGPFLLILLAFTENFVDDLETFKYIFTAAGVLCILCGLLWLYVLKTSTSWKKK